jgi:hypothetical protein
MEIRAMSNLPKGAIVNLECIEGPDGCGGEVLMRWPGYGDKTWPRCERHGEARLAREEEALERYPEFGVPADFDELDAGERWIA